MPTDNERENNVKRRNIYILFLHITTLAYIDSTNIFYLLLSASIQEGKTNKKGKIMVSPSPPLFPWKMLKPKLKKFP